MSAAFQTSPAPVTFAGLILAHGTRSLCPSTNVAENSGVCRSTLGIIILTRWQLRREDPQHLPSPTCPLLPPLPDAPARSRLRLGHQRVPELGPVRSAPLSRPLGVQDLPGRRR